ncbi:MAG: energy transducer TonB [Alistipes sp.]|nr:energy transducer TonB [Alistipes sp.]
MGNKDSKSQINRPQRRHSAPRRHARIDLGNTRSESFGEWLFNHRVGLLVVFAVFVLSGTVLATARYNVERIDLEYLIEIVPEEFEEQQRPEVKPIPSIEELAQRVQNVRNVVSNEAATEQSSGSSDFDEDIKQLMAEIEEGMDSNRAAYEEGMNSVRGAGKGGKGGGDDKGDSKDKSDNNRSKYQGNCTVTYSFEQPVRNHRNLYVPAYTAKGGGVVVLEVLIDRNGAVTSARVASSSNSSLNQVAINAARNYNTRFNIDGSAPSPHRGTITYTFIAQ